MNWQTIKPHATWAVVIAATLFAWRCQSQAVLRSAAVKDERIRVSDSVNVVLQKEAAKTAGRIVQLVKDSAQLARQSVTLRADFAREAARWQAIVDGFQALPPESVFVEPRVPVLPDEVIAQANATIRACTSVLANCEERAANAELRATASDSLWRNAEARVIETARQRNTWRRRAQPSLWEQVKQIPGRAVSTASVASLGYAACVLTR